MNYKRYLKSERWELLRDAAVEAADYRCQLCDYDGDLHVHHRSYATLGTEEESIDLIVLCKRCHLWFHDMEEDRETRKTDIREIKDMVEDIHNHIFGEVE